MRFAYLILAHNNFRVLERLVEMLDDSRNDIFVLYDKKAKEVPSLSCSRSKLNILDGRTDVRWGTYSQIRAYLDLLREANRCGPYDFYHLISGTTLPLKDQDFLHSFFGQFTGSSLLRIWPQDFGEIDFKLRRIHFWTRNFQSADKPLKWITQHFWTAGMFIQKKLGIRINTGKEYFKSDCWASLSQSAVRCLLENENAIRKEFRFSFAGDEFYLLTTLGRDPAQKIENCPNLLYVRFLEGEDHPCDLLKEDYLVLKDTEYLFARKFSDKSI